MAREARRADGERTRERLLEVALPLFAERGFTGTSVRAIAGEAGANVAAIAYYFGDKQGLYDAVVVRLHDDLEADFPADLLDGVAPADLVETLAERAWAFALSHRDHIRLQVRHVLDTGRQPDVVVQQRSEPLLARAEQLVGLFRPETPAVQRRMLVLALMHATVRLSLESRDQLSTMLGGVDDLDGHIVVFLAGLLRRELGIPKEGGS